MRGKISPTVWLAAYALAVPLGLGGAAIWPRGHSVLIERLREWQTLEAGFLAIAAACIGAYFVHRQTLANVSAVHRQTVEGRRQESARLAKQHSAARAVLPLALSSLTDYALDAAHSLAPRGLPTTTFRKIGIPPGFYEPPRFDATAIAALAEAIESADAKIGDRIALVISEIQILAARLASIAESQTPGSTIVALKLNAVDYVLNAAVVLARVNALFAYARRETDIPPAAYPSPDEVVSALNMVGFDETSEPDLYKMARVRAERNQASTGA